MIVSYIAMKSIQQNLQQTEYLSGEFDCTAELERDCNLYYNR